MAYDFAYNSHRRHAVDTVLDFVNAGGRRLKDMQRLAFVRPVGLRYRDAIREDNEIGRGLSTIPLLTPWLNLHPHWSLDLA